MHHDPLTQERAINLSILTDGTNQTNDCTNWERPRGTTRGMKKDLSICQFLLHVTTWWVFPCWGTLSRKLHSWWCQHRHPPKLGQHLIAVALIIWPYSECKRWNWWRTWRPMDTTQAQVEWMDMEATRADMRALVTPSSFCERHRGRVLSWWWFAPVYDTDCLQPLKQTHGCSTNDLHDLPQWCFFFFLQASPINIFVLSWIVKDATTFEMELCGCKQATAQAHVRPHCVWLNFEHTKNSNRSKNKFPQRQKSNSNLPIDSKNHPKSFELVSGRMVSRKNSMWQCPEYTKMQCNGSILSLLRKKDWSEKRIEAFPDEIKRNHSLRHSPTNLYWKSGVHKDTRSQIQRN